MIVMARVLELSLPEAHSFVREKCRDRANHKQENISYQTPHYGWDRQYLE